jgi:outer membrane protein assembly factor BamB
VRHRSICYAAASLAIVIAGSTLSAENWPHWRGPLANGHSGEKGLPVKWSPTENVAWKLALPSRSGATPIIWGDRIFLNVALADGAGDLEFWVVDRAKGDVVWKRPLGGGNMRARKQNMSSPSPVTDGKNVWVMTGTGVFKAFDFSGKELWARDIQKDYGPFGLNWGYASSPLLYGDSLFVQVLHGMKTDDPSYLLRIDKMTGKTLWRVERPTQAIQESPDSYATPLLVKVGSAFEIVTVGGDVVTGHDPKDGKELWRLGGLNPENNPNYRIVASPFVISEGVVGAPSRVKPLVALKPGGRGDVTESHKMWSFDRGPDVPTPISDGKYVYVVDDRGVVHCLDAKTGAIVYGPERLKSGTYSASPVLADGKIYITNEDGLTSVFAPGPKFELIAENALEDYCLSSPAISDGQIFIRTTTNLWAIGDRRKKS